MCKVLFIFLLIWTICNAQEKQNGTCFYSAHIVVCDDVTLEDGASIPNQSASVVTSAILYNFEGSISLDTTLKKFPQVTTLNIQSSIVHSFDPAGFALTDLTIWGTEFPEITQETLQTCCKNLDSLDLMLDTSETFDQNTFQNLPSLTYLRVEKGVFSNGVLTTNAFTSTEAIRSLELDDLSITSVDQNAFESLANLRSLTIRGNNITAFQNDTFKYLNNLTILTIDEKNLITFDSSILSGLNIYILRISLELSGFLDYMVLLKALPNLSQVFVYIDEETIEFIGKVEYFCSWLINVDGIGCGHLLR